MKQSLSYIHPEAKIGKNVIIDPFVTIEKDVEIGDGTHIYPNVTIMEGTRIGQNCEVYSGAVIGANPQDLKYEGEKTYVFIGDNTTIRECVTVNKGTKAKGKTVVGNNCLLMAYCHIAHDCILKDNIILGNATQVAGEVEIDDFAILGGGTLVHQFSRIGRHVMVQGGSKITKDIPPYITAGREPIAYVGLNSIGLRRRKYTSEIIDNIKEMYRTIYQRGLNTSHAIELIEKEVQDSDQKSNVVSFIKNSKRGIIRG